MPFELRSKLIGFEDNWKRKKKKKKLRIVQGEVTFGVSIEGNLLPAEAHGSPLEKRADACIEQVRVYVVLFHRRGYHRRLLLPDDAIGAAVIVAWQLARDVSRAFSCTDQVRYLVNHTMRNADVATVPAAALRCARTSLLSCLGSVK